MKNAIPFLIMATLATGIGLVSASADARCRYCTDISPGRENMTTGNACRCPGSRSNRSTASTVRRTPDCCAGPTDTPQCPVSDRQLPLTEPFGEPAVTERGSIETDDREGDIEFDATEHELDEGSVEEAIEEAHSPVAPNSIKSNVPTTQSNADTNDGVVIPEPPTGFRRIGSDRGSSSFNESATGPKEDRANDPPEPPTKEVHLQRLPVEFDRYGSALRTRTVRNVDYDVKFGTRLNRRNDRTTVDR